MFSRAQSQGRLYSSSKFSTSLVSCAFAIYSIVDPPRVYGVLLLNNVRMHLVFGVYGPVRRLEQTQYIYICNKFNTESIFGNDLQLQNAASNSCFVRFPHAYRTIKWRQSRVRRNDSDDAYYYLKKRMT